MVVTKTVLSAAPLPVKDAADAPRAERAHVVKMVNYYNKASCIAGRFEGVLFMTCCN